MECNRDEAIRARTIAEGKLANRDFVGAKKFTLKAQSLYPDLEGLSQLLTTVEVYIAAENKVSGEVDWYSVLGVTPSADDETIRKQYRKLALVLHPDKNKCGSADGAFKLLSEAWSLLSDKAKRLAYNQRRSSRGFQQKVSAHGGGSSSAAPSMNGFHNFTNRATSKSRPQKNATSASMGPSSRPPPVHRRNDTFWTVCHRCKMHYEYLKVYLNHNLLCPNCQKPFLASETAPPVNFANSSYPASRQRVQSGSNCGPSHNPFDPGRNPAAGSSSGVNKPSNVQWGPFSKTAVSNSTDPSIAAKAASVVQQANERLKREREESYAGGPMKNRKFDDGQYHGGSNIAVGNGSVKMVNEFGLRSSLETDSISISKRFNGIRELTPLETRNILMQKSRGHICRKLSEWSSKVKQKKKVQDSKDDKKEKKLFKNDVQDVKQNGGPKAIKVINVPDSDFHDFDRDRSETSFQDNQVWAGYDDDDGMPRYYALIHKVLSGNPFKMKISWLNSKTSPEFGSFDWIGKGFLKTCGEFRVGRHEVNRSLNSFSHRVELVKTSRGSVLIFPRKGDVWALYRNWSSDWNMETPDDVIHAYDMVQVVDDYDEEKGIPVTPLVKVTGFRTVFHPNIDHRKVMRIPRGEMFRFSHQVPSYLLTGEEAKNVPRNCLELDPASTPLELLQVVPENGDRKSKEEEMLENGEATMEGKKTTTSICREEQSDQVKKLKSGDD